MRLVRGEIDFVTAFWIYATFIPSALFFFVTLILLELLTDTQVVVVISLIWFYTVVAWIGVWHAGRNYQGPAEWKFVSQLLFCAFMVLNLYTFYTSEPEDTTKDKTEITMTDEALNEEGSELASNCTALGISLHGGIVTYVAEHAEGNTYFDYDVTSSEYFESLITKANEDSMIKGILIEVDSGGGSPVAGEEIANAIKYSKKPIVAYIRDIGASTAYLAVSSADKILASRNFNVGSIGVSMSYLSSAESNITNGFNYEELNTGKFKDSGSPDKPLTAEERALFMRDLTILHNNFVNSVAENRNLSPEKVQEFADGSTVLGEGAKEIGRIDEIGGRAEAEMLLGIMTGVETEVCVY